MNCQFQRTHHAVILFAAISVLIISRVGQAEPADLDVFTDFENISTAIGQPFDIGSGDTVATFTGDAFSGVIGVGQLYHSGLF